MLGAIGRIHVEGRVNKLPPRLVKSVSSRINALADTKMSMLVELAVELVSLEAVLLLRSLDSIIRQC